jgi:nucleoside-diphosphate-sugar epimerase
LKILVTGGAGYLGSVLVPELLARGHAVRVYDAMLFGDFGLAHLGDRCSIVRGDIRERQRIEAALAGCEAVIHLAALVGDPACARDSRTTIAVNDEATRMLVELAHGAGARRLIFSSTCSNYGVSDPAVLATEATRLKPVSLYAETKVAAETAVCGAGSALAATVFRLATLFGCSPRMRFDTLVNEFVRDAAAGRKLMVYGPSGWRPLLHVRDGAAAFVRSLELAPDRAAGVFNIVGANCQKHELAHLVGEQVPDLAIDVRDDRPDPRNYRVSGARWTEVAGAAPFRTVREGIGELLAVLGSGTLGSPYDPKYQNAG